MKLIQYFVLFLVVTLVGCGGDDSDSSSKSSEPKTVSQHVVIENRFAQDVYLEFWTGRSLEYRNGEVHGYYLKKVEDIEVNARDSKDLEIDQIEDWLVVLGVKEDNQYYYLTDGSLESVNDGDIVSITSKSDIEHLKVIPEVDVTDEDFSTENDLAFDETKDNNENYKAIKFIADLTDITHQNTTEVQKLLESMAVTDAIDELNGDKPSSSDVSNNWSFSQSTYSHTNTGSINTIGYTAESKVTFYWPLGIEGYAEDELITQDMRQAANYFDDLGISLDLDGLEIDYDELGELARLYGIPSTATSYVLSNTDDILEWASDLRDTLSDIEWKNQLLLDANNSDYDVEATFERQTRYNIYIDPDTPNFTKWPFKTEIDYKMLPYKTKLDSATVKDLNSNETIELTNWLIELDPNSKQISQAINFTVSGTDDDNKAYQFQGELYVKGAAADNAELEKTIFLRDADGNVIYIQ